MTSNVRMPAVAGRFYPRDPDTLRRDVLKYISPDVSSRIEAIGCVPPPAGYLYSAHVAGRCSRRVGNRWSMAGPRFASAGTLPTWVCQGVLGIKARGIPHRV